MAAIELRAISKSFGPKPVLSQLSLDVADGEFLVLLGPSGCGKTTLLRILAGLAAPSTGQVWLGGRDITHCPPRERDIAMVFQNYALYPHLNVARNLGFGLATRRRPAAEVNRRVQEVATQLRLTGLLERKPRELSGGQRQRVALGRAMVREPQAFLMDEPLSNLDAQLRNATRLELTELHRSLGSTFVYVTHDQVEAMTMGTQIAILDQGRLEQVGTAAAIYDEPETAFVAGFIGAPPMNLIPATLATEAGRVHARADGVDLPLWTGAIPPRAVLLGARPEHLRLTTGPGPLRGRVVAVENLGSDEIAFLDVGGHRTAVRATRPIGVSVGQHLTVDLPSDRAFLFDAATGRRLVWVDDEVPTALTAPQPAAREARP